MSGYGDVAAKQDMEVFFSQIERPRGVHLCGNPDWDFLLTMDIDVLSLDTYSNAEVFVAYAPSIKRYLQKGGSLVWGIVPTNEEPFGMEDIDSLEQRLTDLWDALGRSGVDREEMLARSMLSPATCCLVNPDGEKTVERAFAVVQELSMRLREKNRLP